MPKVHYYQLFYIAKLVEAEFYTPLLVTLQLPMLTIWVRNFGHLVISLPIQSFTHNCCNYAYMYLSQYR